MRFAHLDDNSWITRATYFYQLSSSRLPTHRDVRYREINFASGFFAAVFYLDCSQSILFSGNLISVCNEPVLYLYTCAIHEFDIRGKERTLRSRGRRLQRGKYKKWNCFVRSSILRLSSRNIKLIRCIRLRFKLKDTIVRDSEVCLGEGSVFYWQRCCAIEI